MALTVVTIEWVAAYPSDTQAQPVTGGILFQLVDSEGNVCGIVDSATGQAIVPQPIQGQMVSGTLCSSLPSNPALQLVANDDPTTVPVGTTYLVTEQLAAGNLAPWNLTVHHTAPGGVLNLSSQRPTPS